MMAAKVAISATLTGLLVWRLARLSGLPSGSGWTAFLLAWLVQALLPFLQVERWRLVCTAAGIRLPFMVATENVYVGQFFNQVLPSSIGGDAVRVWRIRQAMPVEAALSTVLSDRIVALLAIPLILVGCSGTLLQIVPAGPLLYSLIAISVASLGGLALLLVADRVPLPRKLRGAPVVKTLLELPAIARRLFLTPGYLAVTLLLSMLIHLGVGLSLFLLAKGLGLSVPLPIFVVLAPITTLVTMVPISVGGWGVREGVLVTALGLLHVAPGDALSISIQFGIVMLIVGIPGGLVVFLRQWVKASPDRHHFRRPSAMPVTR